MPRTPRERDSRLSDAVNAAAPQAAPPGTNPTAADGAQNRVAELRVSGHLMTLDTGVFCIFPSPGSPPADQATGLPGVRLSLPPGLAGRPDAVSISTFRSDGWLDGAALVRVTDGPAQVLVTIYQSRQATEGAPRLQVTRLSGEAATAGAPQQSGAPARRRPETAEMVAHVQRAGDVGARIGEWIGTPGSRMWIEGFSIAPQDAITAEDIEYQAVLGRGWLSPWVEGGKFCGSRGMALPLLGLTIRLKGAAARNWDCTYSATFTDGSEAGPVSAGETCEAESLAALEAFQIMLTRSRRARARKAGRKARKPGAAYRRTRTLRQPREGRGALVPLNKATRGIWTPSWRAKARHPRLHHAAGVRCAPARRHTGVCDA